MNSLTKTALVFLGGGLGSTARYWLGGWIQSQFGPSFPWGTLAVNATGSLLIGLFLGLEARSTWDPGWRLFVAIGLMGGYTTFSTFSYETLNLLTEREYASALGNALGHMAAGLFCVYVGVVAARLLAGV